MNAINALIIGNGKVGREISKIVSGERGHCTFFTSKDPLRELPARIAASDIVFLAIPTEDKGETALHYIQRTIEGGKNIVTCEKGALAYHFEKIKPLLPHIGYSAVVGGASGMLYLLSPLPSDLKRIVGVINGTVNFLFCSVEEGKEKEEAMKEAEERGLCEPGASSRSFFDMVIGESHDVLLKLINLFNLSQVTNESLRPKSEHLIPFSKEDVEKYLEKKFRLAVCISRTRTIAKACIFARRSGWVVEAGFVNPSDFPSVTFPKWENNVLSIEDHSGTRQITGLGAGPGPTAVAMVVDARRLLKN
jgi:homoserine dehydrogenase